MLNSIHYKTIIKCGIAILFIITTQISSYSQQETANWYFGENAGIHFDINTNTVTSLNNGKINTREGCTAISDENGNLLFYTDGSTVYNKSHTIMPNGTGLLGDQSSTQSALIVPKPQDPNLFYIFTVDSRLRNKPHFGLNVYTVDIRLDNGLGAVIEHSNRRLLNACSEKISAVLKDCVTGDIWVLAFSDSTGTNLEKMDTFHAFLVSEDGISTPAITSKLPITITDVRGYLKFTPDGKNIAMANSRDGLFFFDFNLDSGQVTNPKKIRINAQEAPFSYGIEFSQNNKFLYVTTSNDYFQDDAFQASKHFSRLLQFDITSGDISSSQITIDRRNLYRGALQLGPDGKIYRALSSTYLKGITALGVINSPNAKGANSNYAHASLSLGSRQSTQGLPPFIQSFFNQKIDIIQNDISSTELFLCEGDTYTLKAENEPNVKYDWYKDDVLQSETSYKYEVSQPGVYKVIAINKINSCIKPKEGVATVKYFDPPLSFQVNDITICDNDNNQQWEFNFTDYNDNILNQQTPPDDYEVKYYTTNEAAEAGNEANAIIGAFTNSDSPQNIYARVQHKLNKDCFKISSFKITLFNTPSLEQNIEVSNCDNNEDGDDKNGKKNTNLEQFNAIFLANQSNNDYKVLYYKSLNDLTNETAITQHYNTNAFSETLYVKLENKLNKTCFAIAPFTLKINPLPQVINTELLQCAETPNNSNTSIFNLNESSGLITNGETKKLLTFFKTQENAENNQNAIANPERYKNTSNPEKLYVRVTDTLTNCYKTTPLTLKISTTKLQDNYTETQCDEPDSEDGINTFNLNTITSELLKNHPTPLTVSYYETRNDALSELEPPLNNIYRNENSPYQQTLYARAENQNGCYGITQINLVVNKLPKLKEDETLFYCLNTFPETLKIDAGILNDNLTDYAYQWSTGATNAFIKINKTQTVSVTVTNKNGCSKSRTITIVPSDIATIESIAISDGSVNNTVSIIASGNGEYQYALMGQDNLILAFQDEAELTNVPAGIYTLLVKDIKNDCGTQSKKISIIGFPKFFTPNNDGKNDYWRIAGTSKTFQPNTLFYIYDRYGKLLANITPSSQGWDGTYNGKPMPADDYWFVVKLEDGRIYKSNFSLKR